MVNNETVAESLSLMKAAGWPLSESFQKQLVDAENPVYKIAVVGRYQIGKSTLVNNVFLRDNFLATGCGLCKTSVVTKLSFGPEKKVTAVIKREDGALEEQEITDPNADTISAVTAAEDSETRLALAKKYVEVAVEWPCQSLKNYIVYDTPGIEDPIEELLDNTTYRILPQVDLVTFVVEPKQLTEQEIAFLKHKLFKSGLKRAIVLISYNPAHPLSKTALEDIKGTIQAQLASIGRNYFPVHIITYDENVDANALCTPEAIEKCIVDFVEQNAELARNEKLNYSCACELTMMRNSFAARLSVNGKSDEEIAKIKAEIDRLEEQLQSKYMTISTEMKADFSVFQTDAKTNITVEFGKAQAEIVALVDSYTSYDNLRSALPSISRRSKAAFETAMININNYALTRINAMLAEREAKIDSEIFQQLLPSVSVDVTLNSGWGGKLNPKLVALSEYGFMTWALGPLGAAIRLGTIFVPTLRELLPINFIRRAVANSVKKSLQDNMGEFVLLLEDSLKDCGNSIFQALAEKFVELHKLTCEPYRKAIEEAKSKKLSHDELLQLDDFIHQADELSKKLN